CHIAYGTDFKSRRLERPDCRVATGTRSLNTHFQCPHAGFARAITGRQRGLLRGERRAFSGTFEPESAGARPTHDVTFHIRDRDGRVVERGLNMGYTARHDLLLFFLCALFFGLSSHLVWSPFMSSP